MVDSDQSAVDMQTATMTLTCSILIQCCCEASLAIEHTSEGPPRALLSFDAPGKSAAYQAWQCMCHRPMLPLHCTECKPHNARDAANHLLSGTNLSSLH